MKRTQHIEGIELEVRKMLECCAGKDDRERSLLSNIDSDESLLLKKQSSVIIKIKP